MTTDSKELARLHELMCSDALEGGLSLDESVACQRLADRYPQVNTQFYWEALGAADLVLDGSGAVAPPEVREGWVALSESLDMAPAVDDRLDQTVAVWNDQAVDVEQYAAERSLGSVSESEGAVWPWLLVLALAVGAAGVWLYPDVRAALERNETVQQWLGTLQPVGDDIPVSMALTGESVGSLVWDSAQQFGRLEINTRAMTVDTQRQPQVWLVDSDRERQHVPIALLSVKRVLQTVELESPVRIRNFAGLVITSEPLGGSLTPSENHILAVSLAPPER